MEKEVKVKNYPNLRTVYLSYAIDDETVVQFKRDIDAIIGTDKDVYNDNIKSLGDIDKSLVDAYKKHVKFPPIILDITSPGGSVYHGLAIYDIIKSINSKGDHKIIARVSGMCASMATYILLACDERVALTNTSFLIHSIHGSVDGNLQDMRDDLEECERINKICRKIYTEHTEIPIDVLDDMESRKKEWWISAEDALKYKLITAIE